MENAVAASVSLYSDLVVIAPSRRFYPPPAQHYTNIIPRVENAAAASVSLYSDHPRGDCSFSALLPTTSAQHCTNIVLRVDTAQINTT